MCDRARGRVRWLSHGWPAGNLQERTILAHDMNFFFPSDVRRSFGFVLSTRTVVNLPSADCVSLSCPRCRAQLRLLADGHYETERLCWCPYRQAAGYAVARGLRQQWNTRQRAHRLLIEWVIGRVRQTWYYPCAWLFRALSTLTIRHPLCSQGNLLAREMDERSRSHRADPPRSLYPVELPLALARQLACAGSV